MQTKLRVASLLIVACLLWTCPTSTATRKADSKPHYVGIASWYGRQHQGRKMANGKRFDRRKLTAACWWLPLGTPIRVFNLENGKSVVVTVTDRGPNHRLNRVLDLSEAAAEQLDYLRKGLTWVFFSPVQTLEPQQAELDVHWTQPMLKEASGVYGCEQLAEPQGGIGTRKGASRNKGQDSSCRLPQT